MSPRHRANAAAAAPPAATRTTQPDAALDIRFVTTGLSPEEIAAATAVLTAALQQGQTTKRARPNSGAPHGSLASEWTRSTRLRRPLRGDWRGFTAEGL